MDRQVLHRPRHGDPFEQRRRHGHVHAPAYVHTMRRARPAEDIIAEFELRDERQKEQISMLHQKVIKQSEEVKTLQTKSYRNEQAVRDLRQQIDVRSHAAASQVADIQAAADTHAASQDSLIRFGTNAVKEQRVRAESAEAEVKRLQTVVSELESSISELRNLVTNYEAVMAASADDYTRACMEAQASGSVRMIKGYQSDLARQNYVLEKMRTECARKDKALREYEQKEFDRSRELEEGKRELSASARRAETLEGIAEDQRKLIERLNGENARLLALSAGL